MIEKLFKAKRIDDEQWIIGNLVYSEDAEEGWKAIIIPTFDSNMFTKGGSKGDLGFENWYRVEPSTICQYIGMTDRHENKLWENDIVEIVSSPKTSYKYLIWWNKEMSLMDAIPLDGIEFNGADYLNGKYPKFHYETFCTMMQDPWGDFSDIKVIGNIIDNPELIDNK